MQIHPTPAACLNTLSLTGVPWAIPPPASPSLVYALPALANAMMDTNIVTLNTIAGNTTVEAKVSQ